MLHCKLNKINSLPHPILSWNVNQSEINYRPIAEDTRSLAATSLAYKIISASITDIWAFYEKN